MTYAKEVFRRAKIVCTLGPASRDAETVGALCDAGMDVVRVNFSHASHDDVREIVDRVRAAAGERSRPVAVMGDLQGPRLRVGDLDEPLTIQAGESYRLVPEGEADGSGGPGSATGAEVAGIIPTTYADLARDVVPGDRVLLDDGRIELRVVEVRDATILGEAREGGVLHAQKGINLPGVQVGAPSLTEKDLHDLELVRELRMEFVALSFVRRPEDISALRERCAAGQLIIAKIEKDSALDHLAEILRRSDGVMVARGDLGVELPYEDVPLVQKRIIDQGQWLARPSITATQMLDSMIRQLRPTRAEVSDVANALLDGTDAVMLSAETAVGSHPVEAVRTLCRIIRRIERETPARVVRAPVRPPEERAEVQRTASAAVAAASLQAVDRLNAPFIVTLTRSGFTARVMSAQRPQVPILAVTDARMTYNQLALVWGVHPVLYDGEPVTYEEMVAGAGEEALSSGFGEAGDPYVVTAGVPFHVPGTTNMMRIEEL